ncbi:MAG: hypothetical protein ACE5JS_23620 [Nitrospinota bacterium]
MASKRTTETGFWTSMSLKGAGPVNRCFFQWTMTGPRSNYAGLFRLSWDDCMDECELTRRQIQAALTEGARREFICYDQQTRVVWVINRLAHEFPDQKMSERQRGGIRHIVTDLPKCALLLDFCRHYQSWGDPFETLCQTLSQTLSNPMPKGQISYPSSSSIPSSVVGSERPAASDPSPDPSLDPSLQAVLRECPHLQLIANGSASEFWDQILGALEPYAVSSAWLLTKIRRWNQWFADHPGRRSRKREKLQSRLMGWLEKDLETLARKR